MAVSDLNKARAVKEWREEERTIALHNKRLLMTEVENYGRVDTPLLILTLLLICYGLIMLFSVSMSAAYAEYNDPLYYFMRQFRFSVFGFILMFIVARFIPVRRFNQVPILLGVYGFVTMLLLAVFVMGKEGDFGGMRWLELGPIQFQPSEVAKLGIIFCLSSYYALIRKMQRKGKWVVKDEKQQLMIDGRLYILLPAGATGAWMLLIGMQPHLSGLIITFLLTLALMIAAGIPWRVWLNGLIQFLPILLVLVLLLVLLFPSMKGQSFIEFLEEKFAHVKTRLEIYSNPEGVDDDTIFQVRQARYALGSGGWTGKGIGMGQQKAGFLPMVYNDYILPAIGEELGFLGTASVLILFLAYFYLGLRVALNASSIFNAMITFGSTFLITIQAFLNVAVASEVIPSTGVSLPFFSYGGTANLFFMLAASLVLNVSRSGQRADPELEKIFRKRRSRMRAGRKQ